MSDFKSLKLVSPLERALDELGYTSPTPIQFEAIPSVLEGRDLMGIAQTGTGKTAAFALPILNHIIANEKEPPKRGARVLVLAPTRELASQITQSFQDYGRFIDHLSVATIFGGVPIPKQIKRLVGGNDILVATPGRLLDLLNRKAIALSDIEILVLDEADQMMDMGFIHDLRKIIPFLPQDRQTLFFSATMAAPIKKLSKQFLDNPVHVAVTPANTTAEKVEQRIIFINAAEKQSLLALTLLDPEVEQALVFTRTKHGADRVVKRLAKVGIRAIAIHGNKSQSQRQRALAAFRDGEIKVLIATDVAARGIDIDGISHVINFEIPNVAEQYVHRIGRTARANRSGVAISFFAPEERAYLKDIQKLLKTDIPVFDIPEDFVNKARKLGARTPLPAPEKPAPQARKGRGKSRRKKKAAKAKTDGPNKAQIQQNSARPQKQRKQQNVAPKTEQGSQHKNRSSKPKRNESGGHKPAKFKRRPRAKTSRSGTGKRSR